jgi:catechol 2,3-dioxygenase-like lactoylglutathione lyase family enzyme
MKIEHVALYARDLDALLRFYVERLGARPGPRTRTASAASRHTSYPLRLVADSS